MHSGTIPFDDNWRFHLGEAQYAESMIYDDTTWRQVDLPHDWMIEQPRHAASASGNQGGFFPGDVGWYRKHFTVPRAWSRKQVRVEFDGVYHNAEFWLNYHYLGKHPNGYTSFAFELNRFLRHGADNVLTVRVDTSAMPHTRWYAGAGIYRHVRLVVAEPVHIPQWGVGVTTPTVSRAAAVVAASTRIRNTYTRSVPVKVRWSLRDPGGHVIGETVAEKTVQANDATDLKGELKVAKPSLWSPESPHLYSLETELIVRGKPLDQISTPLGIRWFSFSARRGFVLNGEPLLMRGGCVHHDCGPLGSTSIDRAEERKVELLKAAGYNAVRCAHNPPAPAFLDACDRLGMLVIDEAFDGWRARKPAYDYHLYFDEWWQRDLESMLLRDRNHPSIVLWSIGNEVVERDLPEGAEIARMLADHVHRIEPTRPVTAGICNAWSTRSQWTDIDDLFDALDVDGYNYLLDRYRSDHKRRPQKVIVATETYPNQIYEYWKAVETMPWVAGDFVWTALDYLGEAGVGHVHLDIDSNHFSRDFPWVTANCGDIDICGGKRPQSHYRDVIWRRATEPFIAVHPPVPAGCKTVVSPWGWSDVQASWTWPACEGAPLHVEVYFDCDEIELRLNGRSLGRRPAGARNRHIAAFKVPYQPGELRALAYRNRRIVAESRLTTTGSATALRLAADRNPVHADRNDLAYVTIEAVDRQGRRVPDAAPTAFVTVHGPARVAAIANADPKTTEPFRGHTHSLWRGRGLAIIQPTGESGIITVSTQADGFEGDTLKITARKPRT